MSFETLCSVDSKGKVRIWNINVIKKTDYSIIRTEYGVENGKMITSEVIVKDGKNLDKKNATDHYEQAISEAQSKWEHKKKSTNYKKSSSEDLVSLLPMLALDFFKNKNKINFPAFSQPKLDGNRAIYNNVTQKITSRTNKEWSTLINTELYKELLSLPFITDGELYCHDPTFKFEHLGVLRKTKNLNKQDYTKLNCIQYWIYDIIDTTLTFQERNKKLKDFFDTHTFLKIKYVETNIVENEDDIVNLHENYIKDGFEGSMIRNFNGMYRLNYRSPELLKYKDFKDDEFEIVGFSCEKSHLNNSEYIIWRCKTSEGKEFNVQSSGTSTERANAYINGGKYIGSKLWVKFFEYSNDNIPRFPKMNRTTLQDCIRNEIV
jgi:ATP-dependent DNA ligase